MMKIGAIIQARTSSTRLPNKVLKELPAGSNVTVLQQVIRRLKNARSLNAIIVATTDLPEDEPICQIAQREQVPCYRGDLANVLERYYRAAKENDLDVVVRITSDCPCIDPKIVDRAVREHIKEKADCTTNTVVRTYPDGLDVEVFNFRVLREAYSKAKEADEKEHVTPYIYKHRGLYKIIDIKAPLALTVPERRVTLDKPEDYEFLCGLFESLYSVERPFDAADVVDYLKRNKLCVN